MGLSVQSKKRVANAVHTIQEELSGGGVSVGDVHEVFDALNNIVGALRIDADEVIIGVHECDFCEKFDFGTIRTEVDEVIGPHIALSGGSNRFTKEKQFNYCPVCGRYLK